MRASSGLRDATRIGVTTAGDRAGDVFFSTMAGERRPTMATDSGHPADDDGL
jgi:hypothetical protein